MLVDHADGDADANAHADADADADKDADADAEADADYEQAGRLKSWPFQPAGRCWQVSYPPTIIVKDHNHQWSQIPLRPGGVGPHPPPRLPFPLPLTGGLFPRYPPSSTITLKSVMKAFSGFQLRSTSVQMDAPLLPFHSLYTPSPK